MEAFDTSKSVLQQIKLDKAEFPLVRLYVKRDDLIHNEVSGNKWRKLKHNIIRANELGKKGILTFGGAFSNHLLATASACNLLGLKSIGVVRGDELHANSNANLARCHSLGMQLIFLSRDEYRKRNDGDFIATWSQEFAEYFVVPEGGANKEGILGCAEIWEEINVPVDHLFVAQGTTTTSCGLHIGNQTGTKLHVVPVLKGFNSIGEMASLLKTCQFENQLIDSLLKTVFVHSEAHLGGYAKTSEELTSFLCYSKDHFDLPLDFIYTGKAFFELMKWLKSQHFEKETSVVFLHTGGLLNG